MSKLIKALGLIAMALIIGTSAVEARGWHGGGWHGGGWHGGWHRGWYGGGWGPYWGPGYYGYGPGECGWVPVRIYLPNGHWVIRHVWRCW